MQTFEALAATFEERLQSTSIFPQSPEALYEPCRYLLHLGGKRIRPVLCLMAAELFNTINDDAWHAAFAVELFHNFTLIHDDIMDKAPLRRGQPTVHERNGLTAGILCGDVLSMYAFQELGKIKIALPQVLQLFTGTSIAVCEGQQMDMDFESREQVQVEEYIEMIALKTSVLLAAALQMGALIGGATEGAAKKLFDFGRNLGIAFQLQDDYLDAFGESATIGKQVGGDILANKKTFLYLKAIEKANPEQLQELSKIIGRNDGQKVTDMLRIYNDTGADQECRAAAKLYSDKAFQSLEEVAVQNIRKENLYKLAEYLLHRQT